MALEDFYDHTCDIYHIQEEAVSPGYGLAASPLFSYPDEPDIEGLSCHFGVKSQSVTVTQTEPANLLESKIKLTLPFDTDIRINDKIIDCDTGYEYMAEQPRFIREHHAFVYIQRVGGQKPL